MEDATKHRFELSEDAVYQEIDGKIILLNLESSQYYGLNRVGSEFFKLLLNEGDGEAVAQKVAETYDVSQETIFGDLTALVHGLQEAGLVKVVSA
jgi:hypothetical protein